MSTPGPHEVVTPRGLARYYVFRVYTVDGNGNPDLVHVLAGPFTSFLNAWYSAGAIHRIYPNQIFIAGELLGERVDSPFYC